MGLPPHLTWSQVTARRMPSISGNTKLEMIIPTMISEPRKVGLVTSLRVSFMSGFLIQGYKLLLIKWMVTKDTHLLWNIRDRLSINKRCSVAGYTGHAAGSKDGTYNDTGYLFVC